MKQKIGINMSATLKMRLTMDHERRLKRKIEEMLRERTGSHFLDSGRAYGRHWEKNQRRDFENEGEAMVFIHADETGQPDEIYVLYNLYHYLSNFLIMDNDTAYLNRRFKRFSYSEYMHDKNWLICMEVFLEDKLKVGFSTHNTYNDTNLLSQIIQYSPFEWESSDYIILQIHNGCDVRGGYTDPYIFKIIDIDDFHRAQLCVKASCQGIKYDPSQSCFEGLEMESACRNWWHSFDAGIHYHFHGHITDIKPIEEYTRYDKDMQKLLCKCCGGEITFSFRTECRPI